MNQPGSDNLQVLEADHKMETPPLIIARQRRPWRARLARWGIMLVIFVAGGVAGYSVGTVRLMESESATATVVTQPNKFTEYLLGKLKVDLTLTDAQYLDVKKILVRSHEAFNKEMTQLDREMQSVLTPPQWAKYKERMRNRHRRGPGGPGGPPSPGGSSRGGPGRDGHREHGGPGGGNRPPRDSKTSASDGKPSGRPQQDDPKVIVQPKSEPPQADPAVEKK